MTRAMIADPDLLAKAAAGAADEVSRASDEPGLHRPLPRGAADRVRREPADGTGAVDPAAVADGVRRGRRVLVAGGGPAGVAAALEAAAAGHDVVLAERSAALGGQFRVAGRAPAHRETWERYARWIAHRLEADGVDVRLSTEVAAVDAEEYDAVVLATGAVPSARRCRPRCRARSSTPRTPSSTRRALRPGPRRRLGRRLAGLDAAETLAESGLEVTYACAGAAIGEGVHQYQRNLYLARLDRLPVRLVHHTEVVALGGAGGAAARLLGATEPLPTVWGPSCSRRAGCRTTACGGRWEAAGGACAPAMSSGLGAPRRPCWRGRSRRGGWRRWRGRRWWCRAREVRAGRRRFRGRVARDIRGQSSSDPREDAATPEPTGPLTAPSADVTPTRSAGPGRRPRGRSARRPPPPTARASAGLCRRRPLLPGALLAALSDDEVAAPDQRAPRARPP